MLGLATVALVLGGCGRWCDHKECGAHKQHGAHRGVDWLHPGLPPAGWTVLAIRNGAAMSYPPGWKRIVSDSGTATAAVFDGRDHFLGYLNLTPRQSTETLANWGRFRIEHNAEENDRNVTTLAAAAGLRFRTGQGACVRDAYITNTGTRYIELACLVTGKRSSAVVVGASPPAAWARISPLLERAISSLST